MDADVEGLLRDGMDRFVAGVRAPGGLARAAGQLHRRRLAFRAALAGGTAAVIVTAAVAVVAARCAGPAKRSGGTAKRVLRLGLGPAPGH